jgi:hypothetical protein
MVLPPLVALMVGAAIATALFQNLAHGRPSATAEAADTAHDRSVVLVAANYVNRPVDVVVDQLRSYGLDVKRREDPSASVAPGLVSRIDPVGVELVKNDVVTVFYVPSASGGSSESASFSNAAGTSESAAASTGVVQVTDGNAAATDAGTTTEAGRSDGSAGATSSGAPDTSQSTDTAPSTSESSSSAPETTAATSTAAASSTDAGQ